MKPIVSAHPSSLQSPQSSLGPRLSTSALAVVLFFVVWFAVSCSSDPTKNGPLWIHQPSRTVDNGYIVYIGKSESRVLERTQFEAEGIALEDLANECSLVPKGTRIEDRYSEKVEKGYVAYVKVAVEFEECDHASKSIDPNEIKTIANVPFTTQLKKYQDLNETGEMPAGGTEIQPPTEVASAPTQGSYPDSTHFYVTRQYIAYQKEVVVLAPAGSYPPSSPQSTAFISSVQPAQTQVQTAMIQNPGLKTQPQPWSQVPNKPPMIRPQSLTPMRAAGAQRMEGAPIRSMSRPSSSPPPAARRSGRKRRRDR